MKQVVIGASIVIAFVLIAVGVARSPRPPEPGAPVEKPGLIRVSSPLPNAAVTSPLAVTGEARGFWFFEASFPVRLYDEHGREIGLAIAQAQGEWMTENFVPFRAELTFEAPVTESGMLVLEKDNPSGLPEHADELRISVRFR